MARKKLAIITTHPIQYNAPLFEKLATRGKIDIRVFYTWGESVLQNKYDPGFGKVIEWDIPLLKGYAYEFLENTAADKGSHHFNGIVNPDMIGAIGNYQPDALLIYGWSFNSHLKLMRHFHGKLPVIFRGDSTLLDDAGLLARWKRKIFLWWVYRHIDVALYVGKNNADYYRSAGLKNKQLVFGPHAIDNDRFRCADQSCREQAARYRQQCGIPEDAPVFLFAGKLEPKKDPELLLQSFVESGLSRDAHLVIAGNGELETKLKQACENNPQVHFIDFQNQLQMPALYASADVFVLPSRGPGETWGLAVNEAMANGKPVIVSDRCGCAPDLVEQGVNGFVFPSGNKEALQKCLAVMMERKNDWKKMGEASREKIAVFSYDKLASAIESVTAQLAAGN